MRNLLHVSNVYTLRSGDALATLPPEPWGSRMRRARELAHLTNAAAVKKISRYWPTSTAALSRMENSADPGDVRRSILAYVALHIYGFDPGPFGVSADDVPEKIRRSLQGKASGRCTALRVAA